MVANLADIVPWLAAIIAFLALIFTIRAGLQNKRIDVLIDCHKRFDALAQERANLVKRLVATSSYNSDNDLKIDIEAWSERFWSLQFDQFEWWRRGYIDSDFFSYWMKTRLYDYKKAERDQVSDKITIEKLAYIDCWTKLKNRWVTHPKGLERKDFRTFIKRVFMDDISSAMKEFGPRIHQRAGFC
jgi:hypothetical protein